jgi:hypothetical protein
VGEEDNYWIIEIYNGETANVSIMSSEEANAIEDMEDGFEDWQKAPVSEVDEDGMIERAEDHGYEHDPW